MHSIDQLTQGGQVWMHNLRMLRQVVKTAVKIGLFMGCAWMAVQFFRIVNMYGLYISAVNLWVEAKIILLELFSENSPTITFFNKAKWQTVSARWFQEHAQVITVMVEGQFFQLLKVWPQFFMSAGGGFTASCLFFLRKGGKNQEPSQDTGYTQVVTTAQLKRIIKKKKLHSTLHLDALPLAHGHDPSHILITGQSGTGKTNCFHKLLPQIRQRREKAIIVDMEGAFISRYYRENNDILLNPFDRRSVNWNPWKECLLAPHIHDMAARIVPHNRHVKDPFWDNGARALVTAALSQYLRDPIPPQEFYRLIKSASTQELRDHFQQTIPALTHKDEQIASFRQIIETRIEAFQYENL